MVELDFADVEEIGQGFAHEIFVVFQKNHADIKIVPVNTNLEVEKMINHVKNTEENNKKHVLPTKAAPPGCFCCTQNQRNRGDETWPERRTRE